MAENPIDYDYDTKAPLIDSTTYSRVYTNSLTTIQVCWIYMFPFNYYLLAIPCMRARNFTRFAHFEVSKGNPKARYRYSEKKETEYPLKTTQSLCDSQYTSSNAMNWIALHREKWNKIRKSRENQFHMKKENLKYSKVGITFIKSKIFFFWRKITVIVHYQKNQKSKVEDFHIVNNFILLTIYVDYDVKRIKFITIILAYSQIFI